MARTLNCVCTVHAPLLPTSLAEGLSALACEACHGQLLDLDDYRRWVDHHPRSAANELPPLTGEVVDTRPATPVRKCPACSQLMERLQSGAVEDFRLDRCGPCQLLWMDAGEWTALEANNATHRLLDLLSDARQRALRDSAMHQRREIELRARHGDAAIDELIRLRAWLADQPHPELLLNLLRSGW